MLDPSDRLAEALKDRYTLQRELGRGGMATVYLATDVKHERSVALKPEFDGFRPSGANGSLIFNDLRTAGSPES